MRSFSICLWFAVMLTLMFGPIAEPQTRPTTARVVGMVVTDGEGTKLNGSHIKSFINRKTNEDYTERFARDALHDVAGSNIPYGEYDVVLAQPGFADIKFTLAVSEPEVSFFLSARTAAVHLITLDNFGKPFGEAVVDWFGNQLLDLSGKFQNGVALRIPYGNYDLRLHSTILGASPVQRQVDVFTPDVYVLIGMDFDTREEGRYPVAKGSLSGVVKNLKESSQPIYVRLSGVYTNYLSDAKVKLSGTGGAFTIVGYIPMGKYVLLTASGRHVLDMREVEIGPTPLSPIVIELGANQMTRSTEP